MLIASTFKENSYTIYLSDLTNIWSETLDLRGIKKRSLELETTIDPTEGDDQVRIFLDKLQHGVEGGANTMSALTITSGAHRPAIILTIKVELPGGLAPLEWPFQLAAVDSSVLTSHLLVPLLRAQHTQMEEISSLVGVMRDKDHVIQKLLDKLEAHNMDLGQIFPQVVAKGRSFDRVRAAEKINGLGPFDVDAWRSCLDISTSRDTRKLVGQVFGGGGSAHTKISTGNNMSLGTDDWWKEVKGDTINLLPGKMNSIQSAKPPEEKSRPTSRIKKESRSDKDDDFQVQATPPPRPSPKPKQVVSQPPADSSTEDEDEDDLDKPSQPSKIPDSFPPSPPRVVTPPKRKLVSPTSKKKASSVLSLPDGDATRDDEDTMSSPKGKLVARGGKKVEPDKPLPSGDDSTTDDEPISPKRLQVPKSPTPDSPPPPKRKGGLGRLGNKKASPKEPTPPPEESTPTPSSSPDPPKRKNKLGQLGGKGKKKAATPALSSETEETSPKPTTTPKRRLGHLGGGNKGTARAETPPRVEEKELEKKEDTPPEERADRKRLQLKRELEAKAAAGPVKKKRKF